MDKNSDELLALTKTIKNPDNLSKDIGYIRINFKKSMAQDIINKINSIDEGFSYIQNSKGDIIASSDNEKLSKYKISSDLIKELSTDEFKLTKKNIDGKLCL